MSKLALRAADFLNSIGVNTHLSYTDGAYVNVANVVADLAYLGVTEIRDSVPNPAGGIPAANQLAALDTLAAGGIRFDLLTSPNQITIAQTIKQLKTLEAAYLGAILAVEGPNEINNYPVSYDGLSGQAAATAFQADLYSAVTGTAALAGVTVYDFTGGVTAPLTASGTLSRNADGSYTLGNGQIGFPVTLPPGISKIKLGYTGTTSPGSGLFGYPGTGQKTAITYGAGGVITYSYNNTTGAAVNAYVDFIDYGQTVTLTNVKVTGPASSINLVTFDPDLSLAGFADKANIHPYATGGGAIGPLIARNYNIAFGGTAPGPRVITETGYDTDPADKNGVTPLVQARQIVNGLLDAYQSGVSTTYLYELLDEKADPGDSNPQMHFGVFNFDNSPKPAATALHDLTTALADPGAGAGSFTPDRLAYTETGTSAGDNAMLLEKSNGVFDLALWNDADAGISNTDQIRLNFGAAFNNVTVLDIVTGATQTYQNTASITIALGADPMIVKLPPNASAAAGAATIRVGADVAALLPAAGHSWISAGANSVSGGQAGATVAAASIEGNVDQGQTNILMTFLHLGHASFNN